MGNKLTRKIILDKTRQTIKKSGGEVASLTAAAAALRAMGGTTRAMLTEIHIPIFKWSQLRRPPDPETLAAIERVISPLEDTRNSKVVFGDLGEKQDGTGAAYVYINAIEDAIGDTNNRFTREIKRYIKAAHESIGRKRKPDNDPDRKEEITQLAVNFVESLKGGN